VWVAVVRNEIGQRAERDLGVSQSPSSLPGHVYRVLAHLRPAAHV